MTVGERRSLLAFDRHSREGGDPWTWLWLLQRLQLQLQLQLQDHEQQLPLASERVTFVLAKVTKTVRS